MTFIGPTLFVTSGILLIKEAKINLNCSSKLILLIVISQQLSQIKKTKILYIKQLYSNRQNDITNIIPSPLTFINILLQTATFCSDMQLVIRGSGSNLHVFLSCLLPLVLLYSLSELLRTGPGSLLQPGFIGLEEIINETFLFF